MQYKIGELAAEFGISLRTLRHYEDRGLISPLRQGTTRKYSEKDRERLRIALWGREIGLSLREMSEFIDLETKETLSPDEEKRLQAIKRGHLDILEAEQDRISSVITRLSAEMSDQ